MIVWVGDWVCVTVGSNKTLKSILTKSCSVQEASTEKVHNTSSNVFSNQLRIFCFSEYLYWKPNFEYLLVDLIIENDIAWKKVLLNSFKTTWSVALVQNKQLCSSEIK